MNNVFKFISNSTMRRNISMTLSRQILAALAQFLVIVLIARKLGPEGNGQYAMAVLLPTMIMNFLNMGIGPATVYHVGRREFSAMHAVKGNMQMGLALAFVGISLALPVIWFKGEQIFPGVPLSLLILGLMAFPAGLLLSYLSTILQGLEDFRAFNIVILVPPYVTLVGSIISVFLLHTGPLGPVVAYLIGQITGLVLVTVFTLRCIEGGEDISYSYKHYRNKTLRYGLRAYFSNILAFVNYRIDLFLVNFLLTPAATGIYVISIRIAEQLWMLSKAASTVLFPRLSAMHSNPDERLALTWKGYAVVSIITVVAGFFATVVLYFLLGPIFGPKYMKAFPAFLWLLPGVIVGAGARIQSNCIAAAGKPEWNTYVALVVLLINTIGNILLIPNFGIEGAAMATSISYMINGGLKIILARKTRWIGVNI